MSYNPTSFDNTLMLSPPFFILVFILYVKKLFSDPVLISFFKLRYGNPT